MNWKQLHNLSSPEERLEAALLMRRAIEARREAISIYIDLRRILMRAGVIGILAMLTLTAAFITAKGEPALVAPVLSLYILTCFALLLFKPRKQEAHFVRAVR